MLLATCIAGCTSPSKLHQSAAIQSSALPPEPLPPAAAAPEPCSVYLVRHGWHTGLIVRRCDVCAQDWPEIRLFDDSTFIEVGWGDAGYLCSKLPGPIVLANAAFLPSRSAIHVAGFDCPPEIFFQDSQIIEIKMSAERVGRLCRFVHHDLARDDAGGLRRLGPPIYGRGGIYQSKGYYFLPNTCNVWTARGLAAADCPVAVPLCTIAPPLVLQSKRFGREIHDGLGKLPVIYPFVNFDRPTNR